MKKEISIHYEVGFADSEILSFTVETRNVTVLLECWNAKILEIKFLKFISLHATDDLGIADLLEVFESPLLNEAVNNYYEKRPKEHPFKNFKFITSDDTTALDVICEDMSIKRINDLNQRPE